MSESGVKRESSTSSEADPATNEHKMRRTTVDVTSLETWSECCARETTTPGNGTDAPVVLAIDGETITVDTELNDRICLWQGDLTTLAADAIVNAANERMLGGGGIDGAIHCAAGPELLGACRALPLIKGSDYIRCPTGSSVTTSGFKLPSKAVVHTVGPIGEQPELLASCYTSALDIAIAKGFRSIAFCCISTGIFGYPNDKAAHLACRTVRKWFQSKPWAKRRIDRVVFSIFMPIDYNHYLDALRIYFPPSANDKMTANGSSSTAPVVGVGAGAGAGTPVFGSAADSSIPKGYIPPTEPTHPTKGAYLYVVGGRNRGHTVGFCERISLTREGSDWESAPLLVDPRGSHGVGAVGGKVYAVGGGGIKSNLDSCEVFDGDLCGKWQVVAPMHHARHGVTCVVHDGALFALGGWEFGANCTAVVEKFEEGEGGQSKWTLCAPMLQARKHHGVASLNGKIYAFGGAGDGKLYTIASAECYDPTSNNATAGAGAGAGDGAGAGAGASGGAGSSPSGPLVGLWKSIHPLPVGGCCSAVAVGDSIYILTWGHAAGGGLLRYDAANDSYSQLGKLPLPEWYGFGVAAHGTFLYVVGGATKGKWSKCVWRYDTTVTDGDQSAWLEMQAMGHNRRRVAAVVCDHGEYGE